VVNTSDEPVYNCHVHSILDAPGVDEVDQWAIGSLGPRDGLSRGASFVVSPDFDLDHFEDRQLVAELLFTDANVVSWVRTHFGLLLDRSDPSWTDRINRTIPPVEAALGEKKPLVRATKRLVP
jgi:hypothetical protein